MGAKSRAATWIFRLGAPKSHQEQRLPTLGSWREKIPKVGLSGAIFDHWQQLAEPSNLWLVSRTQADRPIQPIDKLR
jgi:hypothetical protein